MMMVEFVMHFRSFKILSGLIITLGVGTLVGADLPRTADGHPDLSGTYDVATLTPLERPKRFGEKLTLTDEEAQEIARQEAERNAARNAPTDPNREAPPAGGDGSEGAAGNVGGYNTFWIDRGNGAFKVDGTWRTSIIVDPPDGRRPETTPAAKKRAKERARMFRSNTGDNMNKGRAWWIDEKLPVGPYDDPELRPLAERCLLGFGSTSGPPMLPVSYNNLKRIVQTEDHVMIFLEMVHDARIVRMNAEHAPSDVRKWMGDSVGHWDGDTLVVDTTNFTDAPALGGATRDLHVVERFKRIDNDTLLYRFTVEDPNVWTKPWTGEYTWPTSENRVYEYACHEGNYSFGGILRGARVLESDILGKSDDE
jgi:hypothetical protein